MNNTPLFTTLAVQAKRGNSRVLSYIYLMIIFTRFMIFKKYSAITLWPFIVMNKNRKGEKVIHNHERIHLRQQIELLVIPFYLWYGIEFLIRYFQYKSWDEAYRNISFEREAYANESDLGYLEKRKFWGFWGFVKIL